MRIAVDGSGNAAIAVWLDTQGAVGDLLWSHYSAGSSTWAPYQLLAQGLGTQLDSYARSYNLALAMNSGGDAVVAWGQSGVPDGVWVTDQAVFTRRLPVGTSAWTSIERRSTNAVGGGDEAGSPRVALSPAGRFAVT
jgi:hypothetical protein